MCRRMVCDCDNPNADLFCCPECDPRLSSQCMHQNGQLTYGSGDTWVENCQQCQCLVSAALTSERRSELKHNRLHGNAQALSIVFMCV